MMNKLLFFLLIVFLLKGCKPLSATYDQYSYTQNTSVKVDLLNIVKKGDKPYSENESEIESVLVKVQKVREYDIHRPNNEITAKMWDILWNRLQSTKIEGSVSPHPIGYFPYWKSKNKLNLEFVNDASGQIEEMYNAILELETNKIKAADAQNIINKYSSYSTK